VQERHDRSLVTSSDVTALYAGGCSSRRCSGRSCRRRRPLSATAPPQRVIRGTPLAVAVAVTVTVSVACMPAAS
jgi:hypothetical protein